MEFNLDKYLGQKIQEKQIIQQGVPAKKRIRKKTVPVKPVPSQVPESSLVDQSALNSSILDLQLEKQATSS